MTFVCSALLRLSTMLQLTRLCILVFALAQIVIITVASRQALFSPQSFLHQQLEDSIAGRPWNERPSKDASGHLIFQSLASLMQMMPNSKHQNGHSIIRASIPAGTLLYHGSFTREYPSRDWLAFHPEHAGMFARGSNGTLFTVMTTRELNFIYFDGTSANKLDAVVDTQDLFFFGEIGRGSRDTDWKISELARFNAGCEWGKQYGLDGIIRMEWEFEIMYCDFSQGLEVVSVVPTINGLPDGFLVPGVPAHSALNNTRASHVVTAQQLESNILTQVSFHGLREGDSLVDGPDTTRAPWDPPPLHPPKGWKGALPFTFLESRHTGTWHNDFPGESRVRVYPSTLVSFFDPSLTSLVAARRSQKRDEYRAGNISAEDIARVRADVDEMMSRDWSLGARGVVDWVGLARVVQDRFSDRLPYMQYLLHSPAVNISERMATVRKQLIVSLIPYLPLRDDIGSSQWFADTAHGCAEDFTRRLPVERFTKQEKVLLNAVEEVLRETCRVYTEAWAEAFDIEAKSEEQMTRLMQKWRGEFDKLIEWLDWPGWTKCEPSCGPDEYCLMPQAKWWGYLGTDPTCLSLDDETLEV
ncbi:hypothetical protein DAEQUDRAFT_710410 [Daedalea quercina L-15889]|uniref:Uncharacterized protein n=1 Tax=Daedalea quercina L-15889 TaxID=1314783 RepID=A0A165QAP6_9APHY|nr:hypothetical protein DAEQUDRAFT_710410 [Daedalea quercina L-15889]